MIKEIREAILSELRQLVALAEQHDCPVTFREVLWRRQREVLNAAPAEAPALERALQRKLTNLPSAGGPELVGRDAAAIERVVRRHWGDDTPRVLGAALDLAKEAVS